jgi:dihydrofolate reductase
MKTPLLTAIVAVCEKRGIGFENKMPWHVSEDLKRFKKLTSGNCVILGRKTFESLGNKPLPNRVHFVVSRNFVELKKKYPYETVFYCESVENAVEMALSKSKELGNKVFVMGGAEIYKQVLPLVNCLEVTKIDLNVECDTWFPEFEKDFKLLECEKITSANGLSVEFQKWVRLESSAH